MQGSVDYQVRTVFAEGGMNRTGQSKHIAKDEARAAGAKTFADVGKATGCHSYSTYDDYRAIAKDCCSFIRSEFGERDITKIESYQVEAYLKDKIENGGREGAGIAMATMSKYSAALEKFSTSLENYSQAKGLGLEYKFDLKEVRSYASEQLGSKNTTSRAYKDPQGLVAAIDNKFDQMLARAVLETGCRAEGIAFIKPEQFKGEGISPIDNKVCGIIHVKEKGGAARDVYASIKTYHELETVSVADSKRDLTTRGSTARLSISRQRSLRTSLSNAAKTTGQKSHSIHGLRWNWSQNAFATLQKNGMSYQAAMSACSLSMGHIRGDVTLHYQQI